MENLEYKMQILENHETAFNEILTKNSRKNL